MRVALAFALIFVTRFAVAAWFDPGRDGDIAWQQWLGLHILQSGSLPHALGAETFTATGAPWVPQEWALSLAVALTLGTPWFALLVALTTLAAGSVLFLTAFGSRRLGASPVSAAVVVVCVAFSMLESYGIRAQVFGWAALAAMMYVLACVPGKSKWWIVPIVVVWANLHASAMLAPVLLALWTAGIAVQERRWNEHVRQHALLVVAAAAATFATPLTYRLPLYAVELLHSPIRSMINEWQPSNLGAISFSLGALPLVLAGCISLFDRKRQWPQIFVFAAVAWLAFTAVRNVPICAIVIAPAVGARLSAFLPERARVNAIFDERPVLYSLYCAAFAAALLSAQALAHSPQFLHGNLPREAVARLALMRGVHRLYCEDFAWCSLALRYPNTREFIDGRCDPFPIRVWRDYLVVFKAKGRWRYVLDERGVDAVLVDKKRSLARALPRWHAWHLAYADDRFALFVRPGTRTTAYRR